MIDKIKNSGKSVIIINQSKKKIDDKLETINLSQIHSGDELKELYNKYIYPAYLNEKNIYMELNEDINKFFNRILRYKSKGFKYPFYAEKIIWHINRNFFLVNLDEEYDLYDQFLTPIEIKMRDALVDNNIEFECQKKVGKYIADFLVTINNNSFLVECDGKDYHVAERDALRDEEILKKYGYETIRFTGSEIFNNVEGCIKTIQKFADKGIRDNKDNEELSIQNLDQFDKMQRKAINHFLGTCLVLAPAGSGKTTVLIQRIIKLIRRGIEPNNILAITFTSKAKQEMATRLESALGERGKKVKVMTYHGLSYKYVANGRKLLNSALNWKIEKAFKSDGENIKIEQLEEIARKKILEEKISQKNEQLLNRFREILINENLFTFDILLIEFIEKLEFDKEFRKRLQEEYQFLLVDECQDNNKTQQKITKILGAPQDNIFWVGDDDQCIYTFAGSSISNVLEIKDEYPNTKEIFLEYNYRCAPKIVEAATNVIVSNNTRKLKVIRAGTKAKGRSKAVQYLNYPNKVTEAEMIAEYCKDNANKDNKVAILYRSKYYINEIVEKLEMKGIEYYIKDRVELLSNSSVKIIHSYLMCLLGSSDYDSWKTMLRHCFNYISNKEVDKICSEEINYRLDKINEVIDEKDEEYIKEPWKIAYNSLTKLNDKLNDNNTKLIEKIEYLNTTLNLNKELDEEEKEEFKNNYNFYKSIAIKYDNCEELNAKIKSEDNKNSDENNFNVLLFTIHSSKGKQFDEVFFVGLNEGILPAIRKDEALTQEQEEEERRVCYVGITRAIKKISLCFTNEMEVSRFIEESKEAKMKCEVCSKSIPKKRRFLCTVCKSYFCPDHIAKCHVCGKLVCSNDSYLCECGKIICNSCGEQSKCVVCNKAICPNNEIRCAECGSVVCDEHSYKCSVTNKIYCSEHVYQCNICGKLLSKDEAVFSVSSNKPFCTKHAYKCSGTGEYYGINELLSCEVCNKKIAPPEAKKCVKCGKVLCEEHSHRCIKTDNYYCDDHVERCEVCNAKMSEKETYYCSVCGKKLCENHIVFDNKTGKAYCSDHSVKCEKCKKQVGIERIVECEWCGSIQCDSCYQEKKCNNCEFDYCNLCINDNGTCMACSNISKKFTKDLISQGIDDVFEGKSKVNVGVVDRYLIYNKKKFLGLVDEGFVRIKRKNK